MPNHPPWRVPLLLTLIACAEAEAPEVRLGGLDVDGDGLLRPADLEPGEAAVHLWREEADGALAEEAHRSLEGEVIFNQNLHNWILRVPLQGVPEYVLHISFDPDSGPTGPAVATTDVQHLSIDVPAREHGGSGEPAGTLTVSEAGDGVATGWTELEVMVPMRSYVQDVETSEQLTIAGVAFVDLEVR